MKQKIQKDLTRREEPIPVAEAVEDLAAAEASVSAETLRGETTPAAENGETREAPVSTPDELAGLEEHFRRASWGGLEQLCCRHCAWDTLNGPAAMLNHLQGNHVAAPGVGSVLLADRSGKEIS